MNTPTDDPLNDPPESLDATALPCADKLAFDTQQEAAASAVVAEYRHGTKLKTYRCRYCDLWHLASR